MLPKENCLKKKKDFKRVFEGGEGFKEDFLILKLVPNRLGKNRFGIIVSRKVSGAATIRNKIKRRIKAFLTTKLTTSFSQPNGQKKTIDAVFIAVPGLETRDFWEMEEIIKELFKKAKLTKNV